MPGAGFSPEAVPEKEARMKKEQNPSSAPSRSKPNAESLTSGLNNSHPFSSSAKDRKIEMRSTTKSSVHAWMDFDRLLNGGRLQSAAANGRKYEHCGPESDATW